MAVKYTHEESGENFYGDHALLEHIRENLLNSAGTVDEATTGLEETRAFLGGVAAEDDSDEKDGEEDEPESGGPAA